MKAGLAPWGRGCRGEVKRNLGSDVLGMGRVQREWIGILRVVGWWLALWVFGVGVELRIATRDVVMFCDLGVELK